MTVTFMDKHGTFTQVPDFLNELSLSPAAKGVYSVLAGFEHVAGEVYIARQKIREKLKLALTTISTAVTELEKKELLKRTGKFKYGSYPIVQLFSHPKTSISKPKHQNELMLTEELATANTQLERHLDLKEQPKKNVCSKILEKNILKESLKNFGIGSNQAQRLISKYSLERIQTQINHCESLQSQGATIDNPAGWLVKAIQKDFRPRMKQPLQQGTLQQATHDQVQAEKSRRAQRLLQQATHAERIGQLEESKRLAQRSLDIYSTRDAQELITRIEAAIKKNIQQQQALAAIPKEEFDRIVAEEMAKQTNIFRRLGITKTTNFHHQAAFEAAVERVILEFEVPGCLQNF